MMFETEFPMAKLVVDQQLLKSLEDKDGVDILSLLLSHRELMRSATKTWAVRHVDDTMALIKDWAEREESKDKKEGLLTAHGALESLKRSLNNGVTSAQVMIDEKTANAIYDILVEYGGASSEDRVSFVQAHVCEKPTDQYRFQGHFGFGGKLYTDSMPVEAWRVDYHPDDVGRDPDLYESLCKAINVLLRQLWEEKNDGKRIRDDSERE